MRWLWVLLATLTLVGCGADTAPSEATFFFPRHGSPLGGGDEALLEGVAVYGDGCLWIETEDGTRYLPLWPADTQLGMINRQPAILGPDRELLVESGDAFVDVARLGGSEATAEMVAELVGAIPERCAADRFWAVGDVLNRP